MLLGISFGMLVLVICGIGLLIVLMRVCQVTPPAWFVTMCWIAAAGVLALLLYNFISRWL